MQLADIFTWPPTPTKWKALRAHLEGQRIYPGQGIRASKSSTGVLLSVPRQPQSAIPATNDHPWLIVATPIPDASPNHRLQVLSGVVSRATWSNYTGAGHPVCTVDEVNANYVSGFALPTKTSDFDSGNTNAISVAAGTHNVMLAVEILQGTRPTNAATATAGSLVFQISDPKPVVYVSTNTASVPFTHYASFRIGTVAVTAQGVVTLTQFRRSDIHLDAPHFYQPLMISQDSDNIIEPGTDGGLRARIP